MAVLVTEVGFVADEWAGRALLSPEAPAEELPPRRCAVDLPNDRDPPILRPGSIVWR